MVRKKVIYGHSVTYRNMCRYNSGVCTLPVTKIHRALIASSSSATPCWLLMTTTGESSLPSSYSVILVSLQSQVKDKADGSAYDPFLLMQDEKKVYGFTLSLYEYIETIPSLWDAVKGMSCVLPASCSTWT